MIFYFQLKLKDFLESVSDMNVAKIYIDGKCLWDKSYCSQADYENLKRLNSNVKKASVKILEKVGSIIRVKTYK